MSRIENSAWRRALQQRWQALADRERLLLMLGGTVLGLALLWWVGLAPAWRTVRAAPQKIEALDLHSDWATRPGSACRANAPCCR